MSSGMNGWSNKEKAKRAYLRRHNVHTFESTTCSPPSTAPRVHEGIQLGGGLASISEQLFSSVTAYHAQIGAGVSASALTCPSTDSASTPSSIR